MNMCHQFDKTLGPFLPRCTECRRGLAMRILSVRPSVCPSVCPSVKRVLCDKMEERSVHIFYIIRTTILVFLALATGGGRPLLREILGQPTPVGAKSPIFGRYSLVALQPEHLAKKFK